MLRIDICSCTLRNVVCTRRKSTLLKPFSPILSNGLQHMKRSRPIRGAFHGNAQAPDQPEAMSSKFHVAGGLSLENHVIQVPLDYSGKSKEHINVFYRIVRENGMSKNQPYLVYLQGGPGFESPRPLTSFGWLKSALKHYQVVLVDQRGTGKSHGISCDVLTRKGDTSEQTDFLKCFRADSIVKDCEAIRATLGVSKWSLLGQSYGGFCSTTYLSLFPQSLQEVYLTGGTPPGIGMSLSADMVYERTFRQVIRQNDKFYNRFPQAICMAQDIVRYLCAQPEGRVVTPNGNYLTPNSFQLLGINCLGFSTGFEKLYYMLENAFDINGNISYGFLKEFDAVMPWDSNPLYAIMHESIYCQGQMASNWAAWRIRTSSQYKDVFNPVKSVKDNAWVYFTGEMVFPWMFDDFAELRKVRKTADMIAQCKDWTRLYDASALARNTVPIAAACYFEDMFVSFELSQETLNKIGCVRQYVTNEYLHDGIREQGSIIFEKLFHLARGSTVSR